VIFTRPHQKQASDRGRGCSRQFPLHRSHTRSRLNTKMSLVSASRRHLAQWATRASVRPMAIIPEFPQVKEIRDAQRVDFFGDQQDIDSRYGRRRAINPHLS